MRHPLLLLLLLALLGGTSWWLSRPPPVQLAPPRQLESKREVDYYLRGLHATTMDANGVPARTLKADEVRHFRDDDTSELVQPQLLIHQGEQPPWQVDAEHGWVSADGELVLLGGEVTMQREAAPGVKPLHLVTRDVRVQPSQDYAETDEQVRVRSNDDRIDATGMQAWFRQPSRIKFLADVKGYYAPPK